MLVNVIIPVYNAGEYLKKCLDSVLRQTFENWKAVIVDDGSTDGSGTVADEYAKKDSRFAVIHKANEGQFKARLDGVAAANGEIVVFLDSDDRWTPNCLERIVQIFENDSVDIVMFPAAVVEEDGTERFRIGYGPGAEGLLDKRVVYENLLTSHDLNSVCLKAFKRSLFDVDELKQAAGVNANIGEDKSMLFPLITKANGIYSLKEVLYLYTYNTGSVMRNCCAAKIPAMISREVFQEMYKYMSLWNMDNDTIRKKIGAYYLRNLMACYYKMRKYCVEQDERRKFREYPWKHEMGRNPLAYLFGENLTIREKAKLVAMWISV